MTTSYKQVAQPERYQIEALCKLDYSARSVALQLGRSNKTISNELSRFEGLFIVLIPPINNRLSAVLEPKRQASVMTQ